MIQISDDSGGGQPPKAIVYCRTASASSAEDDRVLADQETRCREYAAKKGYVVAKVVHDRAVSGLSLDRPGLREISRFLQQREKSERHVLVVDDLSRLGRSLEANLHFRQVLAAADVRLDCRVPGTASAADDPRREVRRPIADSDRLSRGPRR